MKLSDLRGRESVIDREGIVRWAHVEETPGSRRENVEILAQVAALA